MAETNYITHIKVNNEDHPLDALYLGDNPASYYQKDYLVTSIDKNSSDIQIQYPSAKCVYTIVGDLESLLNPEN